MRAARLRRDLRLSLLDGAAYNVMMAMGENLFPAFVLALGLSEIDAGLVAAVPLLLGCLLQLVTPYAVRRCGSYRMWTAFAAGVQALSLVPLAVGAFQGSMSRWAVFAVVALYFAGDRAAAPSWVTWIGWLVPQTMRTRYFARRSWICYGALLVAMFFAGVALRRGEAGGRVLLAFGGIFLAAFAARALSTAALLGQSEPRPVPSLPRIVSWRELFSRIRLRGDGRLLLYLVLVQMATFTAVPYLAPYLLEKLRFDYGRYMILLAAPFLARMAAFPWSGRIAHRFGPRALLWIGGVCVVPIPAGWGLAQGFLPLLIVQVLGGMAWAAWELAAFLLFFETLAEEERTSLLTAYYLLLAVVTVGGGTLGAIWLSHGGETLEAYRWLFLLSVPLRAATLLFLPRREAQALR